MAFWLVAAKVAVIVTITLVTVLLGGKLVNVVFRAADGAGRSPTPPPGQDQAPQTRAAASQLRGGAWIGMLERLAIIVSLLSGYPEGIAVTLAIKGLARYPELKAPDTGVAERFIIGTFTSALLAVAGAGLADWIVGLW